MIKFMLQRTTFTNEPELVFKIRKALKIRKAVELVVRDSPDSFDRFTLGIRVPYSEKRVAVLHSLLKNSHLPITNVWRLKNDNVCTQKKQVRSTKQLYPMGLHL